MKSLGSIATPARRRDAAATRDALLAAGAELFAGGKHLDPELVDKPARVLGAVQRIVERGVAAGDFRPVDPLLTHLSLVGGLVFFFATARFRERVLATRRPRITPPAAVAYVKHMQDLLTHGLAAERRAGRR